MRAGELSLAVLRRITNNRRLRCRRTTAAALPPPAPWWTNHRRRRRRIRHQHRFRPAGQTRIPTEQLELLQRNLLLSHAAGVGPMRCPTHRPPDPALKINRAGRRGHSGITMAVIDALLALLSMRSIP